MTQLITSVTSACMPQSAGALEKYPSAMQHDNFVVFTGATSHNTHCDQNFPNHAMSASQCVTYSITCFSCTSFVLILLLVCQ